MKTMSVNFEARRRHNFVRIYFVNNCIINNAFPNDYQVSMFALLFSISFTISNLHNSHFVAL
jgi:hypothetical protein